MKEEKEKNPPPIKTFSSGALNIAIWKNKTEATDDKPSSAFPSVTFERRYKDKEDNWKTTYYLNKRDLIKLEVALRKLIDWAYSENVFKGTNTDEEEKVDVVEK